MPEVSRFFGIVIGMFYNEHGPPHFHAVYGEHRMSIEVGGTILGGSFPVRALKLVLEWEQLNRDAILENWSLARKGEPLKPIRPLE